MACQGRAGQWVHAHQLNGIHDVCVQTKALKSLQMSTMAYQAPAWHMHANAPMTTMQLYPVGLTATATGC